MKARVTKEEAIAELKRRQELRTKQESESKGFNGVANDVSSSLQSAYPAFTEMVNSIPGGAKNIANYATSNNPVSTLANVGAGGAESAAGLMSSPQILMRYLAEKFPAFGKRMEAGAGKSGAGKFTDPTFYESLKNFENQHGLAPQSEEETSVRNAGGLLFGGKALSKLGSVASRASAMTAEQAGRGGDPVHAAIMGVLGDYLAKGTGKVINKAARMNEPEEGQTPSPPGDVPPMRANIGNMPKNGYMETMSNIPQAAKNIATAIPGKAKEIVSAIPEVAGTAASNTLDTLAGLGKMVHLPVIPSLTEALSDYVKYKSVPPEKAAMKKVFGDIEAKDLPKIKEGVEAARRLKLSHYTPAEATRSPFEAAKQATIGRTSSGSKLLYEKGGERKSSEKEAVNTLLDTVYDAKHLEPKKQQAYAETMKAEVPHDFITRQMERPVIQKAIKTLEGDAAYKQKIEEELGIKLNDIKPTSFMYWDMVKRVLGDMGENTKENGRPTTKSDIYADTRRSMVKEMDAIEPKYETARGIAERKYTRQKLEDIFDNKSMTINNFKTLLGSKKKFNEIMNKLKAFPEAQQMLKDMKLLFGESGDLIPMSPTIRTAAALEATSMSSARNKVDAMKRILDQKYGKEHDVANVNLITHPEWFEKLSEKLNKKKGKK